MRKTDLTDRRPMETLTFYDVLRIMDHTTSELEKRFEPGTVSRNEIYYSLICDAYNAGFLAGNRRERLKGNRK